MHEHNDLVHDMLTEDTSPDDVTDKMFREIFDIDDETFAALKDWLSERWKNGEQPTYDQIGKWIDDHINRRN